MERNLRGTLQNALRDPLAPGSSLPWDHAGGGYVFSPIQFGSDLLLWLRDDAGITLSTVGEWKDQSPSGLLFAQATQANRPVATGGAAVFDAVDDFLTAGAASIDTSAGCTVLSRFKLTNVPGATHYRFNFRLRTNATPKWCALFLSGAPGYQTCSFAGNNTNSATNYVGVAETLDTSVHTRTWTYNGGADPSSVANYSMRLDGVAQTVLTSGVLNNGTTESAIGAQAGSAETTPEGTYYGLVIYSSVLSAANQLAAETLIASASSTYADFAALGTVVCCLLPGVGQSGDMSAWADQGPAGNNVSQATLANQPYWDKDDSVGDLKASVVGPTAAAVMSRAAITALNGATGVTYGMWLRAADIVSAPIGSFANAGQYQLRLVTIGSGGLLCDISNDGTNYRRLTTTHVPGAWEHLAVVFDGSLTGDARCVLYRNGALLSSTYAGTAAAPPAALPSSTDAFAVFGEPAAGLAGRLDQVVVVKRALTPAQVAQLAAYRPRSG